MSTSSILDSTKKILGLEADYDAFDLDIVTHINSVFFRLNQIGIGPSIGFMIEDNSTTWDAYLGNDPNLNAVKTYMYLRVRLLFDPPSTSFHLQAINEQLAAMEWQLNVYREGTAWTDPSVS